MAEKVFGIEQLVVGGNRYQPLDERDVFEVLETFLGIGPQDLEVVQMKGPNPKRVDIRTKTVDVWTRKGIHQQIDNRYVLSNGKVVLIVRPFDEYTEIRINRVPIIWDEQSLLRIFSFYGDIKTIKHEWFVNRNIREEYVDVRNGTYRVKMIVKRDIPSTLVLSNYKIEIFYRGQKQTCWKCGRPQHTKNDCTTRYGNYANIFSMDDFPVLNDPEDDASSTAPEEPASMLTPESSASTTESAPTDTTEDSAPVPAAATATTVSEAPASAEAPDLEDNSLAHTAPENTEVPVPVPVAVTVPVPAAATTVPVPAAATTAPVPAATTSSATASTVPVPAVAATSTAASTVPVPATTTVLVPAATTSSAATTVPVPAAATTVPVPAATTTAAAS
ncbi:unnamed protein product, partial [Meganyctiphanes norvegica]